MNISAQLQHLKEKNLFRQVHNYTMTGAVQAQENSEKYLILASNNYLGLTHNYKVQQAAMAAIKKYGTGAGGARLITGGSPLHSELEREIAQFKQTEAALLFNTGYMANVGVISAMAGPGDVIFSDQLNHASIVDGCRLSKARTVVYEHCDMHYLERLLLDVPCDGKRIIITDGVFSMDGDLAPLPKIVHLAQRYAAMVIVDDAHGVGVVGPDGKGTPAHFGVSDDIAIHIGTLSKALASEGGYAAGSQEFMDYLTNKARSFIFSTAMTPASVAAGLAALQALRDNPGLVRQVMDNANLLRERLLLAGFKLMNSETPIIALITGDCDIAVKMAAILKLQGILVGAIRPPTVPVGTSRLRITVSAAHTSQELEWAAKEIIKAGQASGLLEE